MKYTSSVKNICLSSYLCSRSKEWESLSSIYSFSRSYLERHQLTLAITIKNCIYVYLSVSFLISIRTYVLNHMYVYNGSRKMALPDCYCGTIVTRVDDHTPFMFYLDFVENHGISFLYETFLPVQCSRALSWIFKGHRFRPC